MTVLGIDPGTTNCGLAIVSKNGSELKLLDAFVIKFKNKPSFQEQIIELSLSLDKIFQGYEIDEVAIEDMFFAFNPKSVIKLAQFRGAISLKVLQKFNIFYEYTPLQVKKSLTGNGKSTKEQVAFMVKRVLGIRGEIKPLDITDAMAIAISHLNNSKK